MIKSLLLIGALTFAPINTLDDAVVETPTQEVVEDETTAVEKAKQELEAILSKFLDAKVVALVMSLFTNLGLILGVLANVKKIIANGNGISKQTKDEILTSVNKIVNSAIVEQTKAVIDDVKLQLENSNELNKIVVKTIALSQENTPEARLAIYDLLTKLGNTDVKVIQESKNNVIQEMKEEQEKKEETISKLEEIIEDDGTDI